MKIQFLGTGAGSPAKFRNVSSLVVKLLDEINEIWMFDCGEGTQHQILHTTIRPRKITKIFITHLHGDHVLGLPGFLSSRSFQSGEQQPPLTLYGPVGLKRLVQTCLAVTQTKLPYQLNIVELNDDNGVVVDGKQFMVKYAKLEHRVNCYGYRIEQKPLPGELLVDKLRADNIPAGPIYGQLKAGKTVKLADGRVVNGKAYIGEAKPGKVITIIGDTRQVPAIAQLADHADVLVHEGTFGRGEAKLARNYYHSTSIQAAKVAKAAHVKRLLLNHISARYVGAMVKQLQTSAQEVFANVRVVKDFDEYDV